MVSDFLYHAKETSEARRERSALRDDEEMMESIGIPMTQTGSYMGYVIAVVRSSIIASYALAGR